MTKYFYDLGSGCDLPSVVGVPGLQFDWVGL